MIGKKVEPYLYRGVMTLPPRAAQDLQYLHYADNELTKDMCRKIVRINATTKMKEFHDERVLEMVVMTPGEFWRVVSEEAERYAAIGRPPK